jgi:hypothetical protein
MKKVAADIVRCDWKRNIDPPVPMAMQAKIYINI